MGFSSWITQDTFRSIMNRHSGYRVRTIYLIDNKGNKWREDNYDGYGTFGGKNFFDLYEEMNNNDSGIVIAEKKWPNLVEDPDWKWVNKKPKECPTQGYYGIDSRYASDDEQEEKGEEVVYTQYTQYTDIDDDDDDDNYGDNNDDDDYDDNYDNYGKNDRGCKQCNCCDCD
jgi:hypothetical protein